ncbi:MAG: hypothetical protein KAV00_03490 [Phycisphaerae bacterium]|nr:hypothetical protein [Phycisphaerae bacterium]
MTKQDVFNKGLYEAMEACLSEILRDLQTKYPQMTLEEFSQMMHEGAKMIFRPLFDKIPTAEFRRMGPKAYHHVIDRFVNLKKKEH